MIYEQIPGTFEPLCRPFLHLSCCTLKINTLRLIWVSCKTLPVPIPSSQIFSAFGVIRLIHWVIWQRYAMQSNRWKNYKSDWLPCNFLYLPASYKWWIKVHRKQKMQVEQPSFSKKFFLFLLVTLVHGLVFVPVMFWLVEVTTAGSACCCLFALYRPLIIEVRLAGKTHSLFCRHYYHC